MAKDATEKTVEERISAADKKIKHFFKSLSADKQKFLAPTIHQLAVMQVTLERLADEINKGEILDYFEQGSQKFFRENPALKSYNSTVKSYTALFKQLVDMLPDSDANKAGEALMSFVSKPPGGKR